jgi:hypothetical protein
VDAIKRPRTWVVLAVVLVGIAVVGYFGNSLFDWFFSRVEVPPGSFLVRVHRWGKDLQMPEGDSYANAPILAPDDSYKGVQLDETNGQVTSGEGRYYLNPFIWSFEIHPMIEVPPDKALVRTRLYGKPISAERLAAGDFLARDGERGIVADAWGPGKYRINPYAYATKLVDAVKVEAGEVGVVTLKVGDDPSKLPENLRQGPFVVPEGYRGVQDKPLSSGTKYINPYVKSIAKVDTRSHQVEFRDVEFPSRDGFHIKPHVLVSLRVMEEKAPELFVTLSDNGELPQGYDSQAAIDKNPILQKVVLPLVRGYSRIEGSKMPGRDFVAQSTATAAPAGQEGNPREALQRKLMDKVSPACKELGVEIESITVGGSEMDADLQALAQQISDREQARLEKEKNLALIDQYKQEQELAGKKAMKEQEQEKVGAQTKLQVATVEAQQKLEVEQKKLEQDLKNAETNLKAAKEQADAVLAQAQADAEVIMTENEAKVAGLRTAVQGFNTADQFAQFQMVMKLGPALKEIFASDTSDFAKLFAAYMTQGAAGKPPLAHSAGAGESPTPAMPPAGPAGK